MKVSDLHTFTLVMWIVQRKKAFYVNPVKKKIMNQH